MPKAGNKPVNMDTSDTCYIKKDWSWPKTNQCKTLIEVKSPEPYKLEVDKTEATPIEIDLSTFFENKDPSNCPIVKLEVLDKDGKAFDTGAPEAEVAKIMFSNNKLVIN